MKISQLEKNAPGLILILLISIAFAFLTDFFYWGSDTSFFMLQFNFDDSDPSLPIENLRDLIKSMCAHYMTWSGRFLCQSIASIFCTFSNNLIFAICTGVVFIGLIFIILKSCRITLQGTFKVFCITSVLFLIFLTLPLDPSFLVNYLWMGFIALGWVYIQFTVTPDKWWQYIGCVFVGLLAGNSQETFVVPMAMGLTIYLLRWFKIRADKVNWWSASGFYVGSAILICAPGNFCRLSVIPHETMLSVITTALPSLGCLVLVLLMAVAFKVDFRGVFKFKQQNPLNIFLIWSCVGAVLFMIILKGNSLPRTLIGLNVLLLILIFNNANGIRLRQPVVILLITVFVSCTIYEYQLFKINRERNEAIGLLYHNSNNGIIYLEDDLFFHNTGYNNYYNKGWELKERSSNPLKPSLKIYPELLRNVSISPDTNLYFRVGPQQWIIEQSIYDPKPVYVSREIQIGPFSKKIPLRELYLRDFPETVIDTINNSIIGYYKNDKSFMHSELSWTKN